MRATLLPIAALAAGLAACTDAAPRPLPLGEVLGADVEPASTRVFGDAVYWFEGAATPAGVTLRLRRWRDGATVDIDRLDGISQPDQTLPFVVAGATDLIWGLGSAFIGCGEGRWVRAGEPPTPLAMLTASHACRALPLAVTGDDIWALVNNGEETNPVTTLAPYALATGDARPAIVLPGTPVDRVATVGAETVVMMTDLVGGDEGRLVHVELPLGRARHVGAIASQGGFTLTDDQIVAIDNGHDGAAAQVVAFPRDLDLTTPIAPVPLATLPGPAHELTAAGDALWMLTRPPRGAIDPAPTATTLWRLDRDGALTEFTVDAWVFELSVVGDALLLLVENPTGLPTLYRAPLPAQ